MTSERANQVCALIRAAQHVVCVFADQPVREYEYEGHRGPVRPVTDETARAMCGLADRLVSLLGPHDTLSAAAVNTFAASLGQGG